MSEEIFIMTVEKSEWNRVIKEIEQLKKERFQVMWKFKLYADYVKSRNPSLHDRIFSDLGSDVEGYQTEVEQLKRINTLLEECNGFCLKEVSPYLIHEHRDDLEARFHNTIHRANETAKQIDKIRSEND